MSNFIDKFLGARAVDLSEICIPGQYDRRLEIRRYQVFAGEVMHDIDMMSHIGTHVEAPSHYITPCFGTPSKDISEMPIWSMVGEGIFADLSVLEPNAPVTPGFLQNIGVKANDIVVMGNCAHDLSSANYISVESAKWMADTGIKMLGMDQTFRIEEKMEPLSEMYTHRYLLERDIPIIERMTNLAAIRQRRFFFVALPVAIVGLDSFPVRAVAFEGII